MALFHLRNVHNIRSEEFHLHLWTNKGQLWVENKIKTILCPAIYLNCFSALFLDIILVGQVGNYTYTGLNMCINK